jgi:hypothetical protein
LTETSPLADDDGLVSLSLKREPTEGMEQTAIGRQTSDGREPSRSPGEEVSPSRKLGMGDGDLPRVLLLDMERVADAVMPDALSHVLDGSALSAL